MTPGGCGLFVAKLQACLYKLQLYSSATLESAARAAARHVRPKSSLTCYRCQWLWPNRTKPHFVSMSVWTGTGYVHLKPQKTLELSAQRNDSAPMIAPPLTTNYRSTTVLQNNRVLFSGGSCASIATCTVDVCRSIAPEVTPPALSTTDRNLLSRRRGQTAGACVAT